MRALHDVVFHSAELPLRHAMGDEPVVKNLAGLLMDGEAAGAWSIMDPLYVAVIMFHGLHGAVDEAIVAENVDKPIGPMIADLCIGMMGYRYSTANERIRTQQNFSLFSNREPFRTQTRRVGKECVSTL